LVQTYPEAYDSAWAELYLKPHLILGLSGKVLDNSDECGFTS